MQQAAAQEQLRMVLAHTRTGTVASSVFAVLLASHLLNSLAPGLVLGWLAAKLLVAAARIALAQAWLNRGGETDLWQRRMLVLLALDGLAWGLAGLRSVQEPVALAAVMVAALAGVSSVGTFGLQVSVRATAAYVVPMLLPLILGVLVRHDDISLLTALGLLILLGLQLATAWNTSTRLAGGLLLRLEAQTMVAQKDAALRLAHEQIALRTQFLAKVSHELRTPLHGMLGLARLLHLEAADRTMARRLELIESSGTHLLSLINDLLDVARIDSGRFELHAEIFDLNAQLQQVAEVFALRAADKGLDFRTQINLPQPHWVRGDAARLRQVLHNLLGNAVKFTRRGSITLEAGPGAQPQSVTMTVHDTGDGIGEVERQRIFLAFHQAPGGGERPAEGVGLGLTIAREIATAMGGDIGLRSEPGQGASFSFTANLPPAHGSAAALASRDNRRLPRLVLVAEDDEVNAMIVIAFLDSLGVPCERVCDGKQAVARSLRETDRPDMVLMDCRMPVMDGMMATAEIRCQERTLGLPHLPILALTATTADADIQACLAAGMDDVIAKPFTPEQLARALRGAGQAQPAAPQA